MEKYVSIKKLSQQNAIQLCKWKYDHPYDLYNLDENDINTILNEPYYEVLDKSGELIGYFCFGKEAQVPGWKYDNSSLDIGLGLKPNLTGQGKGAFFVQQGINYAISAFNNNKIRLTVASFNKRAIKTYNKLGFTAIGEFKNPKSKKTFLVMELTQY
jgi:[ribosomal protein S18]-alanine N-acetyltransferase